MASRTLKGAPFRGSLMPSLTGASQTAAIHRSIKKTTEVTAAKQANFGGGNQSQGGLRGVGGGMKRGTHLAEFTIL